MANNNNEDIEEDFRPPRLSRDDADLRIMRHEVQSNAQRLLELERRVFELSGVQDKLVAFAKHRQRQWRYYKYYIKVLCDEIYT